MSRTDLDTWEDKQNAKRRRALNKTSDSFVTKLDAAKHALALVSEIPDIVELIDNAEAVRAAAKAKHISAEGINAWTRFVIDAERNAWRRIEKMRAAGELGPATGGKPSATRMVTKLQDLIDHRPNQRAFEWSALAKLTEHQLDEMERIANKEDRLLKRSELLALSKAATLTRKGPKPRSAEDIKAIEGVRELTADLGIQIQISDDAKVNRSERGSWVEAWVWVEDPLGRSDLEE